MVVFECACDQLEPCTEFIGELLSVVSPYVQPTAPVWSQWSECGYHNVTIRPECSHQHADIGVPLRRVHQEVEDGAVMPDVVSMLWQVDQRNIGFDPRYLPGDRTETLLRCIEDNARHIEHGQVSVPALK